MANDVSARSPLSFGLLTERELSSAKRTEAAIGAGEISKCGKEEDLWKRLVALQTEHSAIRAAHGGRFFEHDAGKNIRGMEVVIETIHQLCSKF